MALLGGIIWVIIGIVYIIYKLGEDSGGKSGGLTVLAIAIGIFSYIGVVGWIGSASENSTDAVVFAYIMLFAPFFVCAAFAYYKDKKAKKEQIQVNIEKERISAIRTKLPMPTRQQMQDFISYIRSVNNPSMQQKIYRDLIQKADGNECTWPLDTVYFKDMQAAWIYYSREGFYSSDKEWIFGDHDLSEMQFFNPDIPRSDADLPVGSSETFSNLTSRLPVKISSGWCNRPAFAREAFRMIEDGIELTELNLYPLMLQNCDNSHNFETNWMRKEVIGVWASLYPKMVYVTAPTAINRKEREEWLKVEKFQLICIPAIQEKRFLENEELFPAMLDIYNELVEKEFYLRKRNFVLLWYGLNEVGKAVGKDASFMDYPKYSPISKDLI